MSRQSKDELRIETSYQFFNDPMKKEVSTLSDFITKLDAEFLDGKEAIQLNGGFSPLSADGVTNDRCENVKCPVSNNCSCTHNEKCAVDNCSCTVDTKCDLPVVQ